MKNIRMFERGLRQSANKGQARSITTSHTFPGNEKIKHIVITQGENEAQSHLQEQLQEIVDKHPDSLLLVVDKSQVKKHDKSGKYLGVVRSYDEFFDALFKAKKEEIKFRPYPGHLLAILTGESLNELDEPRVVSLRPDKKVYLGSGKSQMHAKIYGNLPSTIKQGRFTELDEEIEILSSSIIKGRGYMRTDITVVPFSVCQVSRKDISDNLAEVVKNELYHLCMSMYKKSHVDKIQDKIIKEQIYQLIKAGDELGTAEQNKNGEDVLAAAIACTHVIVQTILSDQRHLERIYGTDLDTQSVSTYLTMALTDHDDFRCFAEEIGLIDFSSQLVEDLNSGKHDKLDDFNLEKKF